VTGLSCRVDFCRDNADYCCFKSGLRLCWRRGEWRIFNHRSAYQDSVGFVTKFLLAIILTGAGFLLLRIFHLGILATAGLLPVMYNTGIPSLVSICSGMNLLAVLLFSLLGLHVFPANNMCCESVMSG